MGTNAYTCEGMLTHEIASSVIVADRKTDEIIGNRRKEVENTIASYQRKKIVATHHNPSIILF